MAVKTDGSLWAWGGNNYGQLGDGTNIDHKIPVKIMDDVAAISSGGNHSTAIKTDGSLWSWGRNFGGEFKDGGEYFEFYYLPIKIMDDVASVSAGEYHTIALKKDGSLWAWGWNAYGQLGDGTNTSRNAPVKIMDDVMLPTAVRLTNL